MPESNDDPDMLILRPLGGTEDEVTGIYLPLERPNPAVFELPNPAGDMGNQLSCSLLRDAVRLGFRSGAGPFRSLAGIAVEPRPYQLVPLLMALKLDPVRILIADDVGIGKTVEACLAARELIDRGEVRGLAVLCPPHLAEQWQRALSEQFHIDAELVLSGTAARLERSSNQSLFERYPYTVVSTDYIKSERRRYEFLRTSPDLIIVDEAHTCTAAGKGSTSQRRHELLKGLVNPQSKEGRSRNMILVTATPHSGKEESFRSLLSLLDEKLLELPENLSGDKNRHNREKLARYFVQRRRVDLENYLDTVTPFPDRETAEEHYSLRPGYRRFLDKVLAYCRESVLDKSIEERRQRVRWWSALALLRSLSSSPAAAAATLRNRSSGAECDTVEQIDEEGRRAVLDRDNENYEIIDVVPGGDSGEEDGERRRLLSLAGEAEALKGREDAKLARALELVKKFLADGYSPILFCRFIPTVEYLAKFLRSKLEEKGVVIEAITGSMPPEEREQRVDALRINERRVLVCTDCLSEGINLQHSFDAMMHYDLSWNPTRHEQREGRVDRYGQPRKKVRTLTFYGQDNPVDGIVLQVLLRKHKTIHRKLGVIVPVPMETRVIEDAILEGLLIHGPSSNQQLDLDFLEPIQEPVDTQWEAAVERERRSRTLFAQNQMLKTVKTEVRKELEEVRQALGGEEDVSRFARTALKMLGARVSGEERLTVNLSETSRALKDAIGKNDGFDAAFNGQPEKDVLLLTRTHPVIEGLAAHVLETALDGKGPGRRCGVIRSKAVSSRTSVLLLRMRFHIVSRGRDGKERPLLAEDVALAGFIGSPAQAKWIAKGDVESLLSADADANIGRGLARDAIGRIMENFDQLRPRISQMARERGDALFKAHKRVRKTTRNEVRSVDVHMPVDVLGIYVYLPIVSEQKA